jgi:hypothetical protein
MLPESQRVMDKEILEGLVYSARSKSKPDLSKTNEDWQDRGAVLLKRELLGFVALTARPKTYNVEHIATVLHSLGIAQSRDQALSFVPRLLGKHLYYGATFGPTDHYIAFKPATPDSNSEIRVEKFKQYVE